MGYQVKNISELYYRFTASFDILLQRNVKTEIVRQVFPQLNVKIKSIVLKFCYGKYHANTNPNTNPSRYLLVVYLLFISDLCSIYYITKKNLLYTHSILILTSVDLN